MKFNVHGNLGDGINSIKNKSEIETFLVDNFQNSTTRRRNFDSLCNFWNDLDKSRVTKIWLDGSFCSSKINPNDIDCVVFIYPEYRNVDYFEALQNQHDELKDRHLDVYVCWDKNFSPKFSEEWQEFDYQETYWLGKFGFDRNRFPKGIIEMEKDVSL